MRVAVGGNAALEAANRIARNKAVAMHAHEAQTEFERALDVMLDWNQARAALAQVKANARAGPERLGVRQELEKYLRFEGDYRFEKSKQCGLFAGGKLLIPSLGMLPFRHAACRAQKEQKIAELESKLPRIEAWFLDWTWPRIKKLGSNGQPAVNQNGHAEESVRRPAEKRKPGPKPNTAVQLVYHVCAQVYNAGNGKRAAQLLDVQRQLGDKRRVPTVRILRLYAGRHKPASCPHQLAAPIDAKS